jgi:hypothetical protein
VKRAVVVGMQKTGTTILATVIQHAIGGGARLYLEPRHMAPFEQSSAFADPIVFKLLFEHWMQRQFLLTGIVRGEAGFLPERTVAILRDPRDGLISAVMYGAYGCVLEGASREQLSEWVGIVREKEANPEKYSVLRLSENFNRIFRIEYTPAAFFDAFASYCAWTERNSGFFHLLRYEDFIAGNNSALSAYLGLEVAAAAEVHPELQRVRRTKRSGNWRTMMLPEDVAYLRERYGSMLDAYGYRDWQTEPRRTDPAVGSEYILRIAEEAFRRRSENRAAAPAAQH